MVSGTRKTAPYRTVILWWPLSVTNRWCGLGEVRPPPFLFRKAGNIGSWYVSFFRTTQNDRKLGSCPSFQKKRRRFRRVSTLHKGMQQINGEVGSKQDLLSLAWCTVHGDTWALLQASDESLSFNMHRLYFWPWFPWRMAMVSAPENTVIASGPSVSGNSD